MSHGHVLTGTQTLNPDVTWPSAGRNTNSGPRCHVAICRTQILNPHATWPSASAFERKHQVPSAAAFDLSHSMSCVANGASACAFPNGWQLLSTLLAANVRLSHELQALLVLHSAKVVLADCKRDAGGCLHHQWRHWYDTVNNQCTTDSCTQRLALKTGHL